MQAGQKLVLEGRLRMNTVARQDGIKEKRAELTLARLHPLGETGAPSGMAPAAAPASAPPASGRPAAAQAGATPKRAAAPSRMEPPQPPVWNSAPLVPADDLVEEDDIPF